MDKAEGKGERYYKKEMRNETKRSRVKEGRHEMAKLGERERKSEKKEQEARWQRREKEN